MDIEDKARELLSPHLEDKDLYRAVGDIFDALRDEDGNLWLYTPERITADTIQIN